jgi:glutamate synthase domain-containing protein 2
VLFNQEQLNQFAMEFLTMAALLFVFLIGVASLFLVYMYLSDITQSSNTVRRNYPVIGRFRKLFETLGEFFRQYFFAMDREEMPFNRAQREWIYHSSSGDGNTIAFGSTLPLGQPGTFLLLNSPFPTLEEDSEETSLIVFGEGYAKMPFSTRKIFHISGMSFGALSKPAVRALSLGSAKAGIWLNTGEGGVTPYHLEGKGDIVYQIGTAKYGVRTTDGDMSDERLRELGEEEAIRMFEIKLSQGAKPGKGGILPAVKVTEEIAAIRGIHPFQDSISPNGHPEIHNTDDLLTMIAHVRETTGKPTGFKFAIGQKAWVDELCERIVARGPEYAPDFITVDSADGGTGAAPASLMDHMGLPLIASLPYLINRLENHQLRQRIRIICSGKMVTPAQVAGALCIGADCVVSARGFMFALGCIQALKCNKNTCPTGITTHNPDLQGGLVVEDKAEKVARYANQIHKELNIIAHSCGVTEPRLLRSMHAQVINNQGQPVDLSSLFPPGNSIQNRVEAS